MSPEPAPIPPRTLGAGLSPEADPCAVWMRELGELMTTVDPAIFRAYDIRGSDQDTLTPHVARAIGGAYATLLHREFGVTEIVAGRDNRPTSPALQEAFIDGVRASGADVIDIGLAPSPLLYFAAARWSIDGGCNVTGSHSPRGVNGLKLLAQGGIPLSPTEIQALRSLIEEDDFDDGTGALRASDAREEYLAFLADRFQVGRPLRVVVDPGNGVATCTGPEALRRAGCDVIGINLDLDGRFPNHLPDPQIAASMAALQRKVIETEADFGVAWDGDGDRVGVVDETGARLESDAILALLARDLLDRRPGERVLVDVKISLSAINDICSHGGVPVFGPSGHSLAKRKMRDEGILLGGEATSHFYFAEDYDGFDDGVYAACLIARLLGSSPEPLSARLASLPSYVTSPEFRLPCDDRSKFALASAVTEHFRDRHPVLEIDGARIDFGDGWALVRASNTEPVLSVRLEAETEPRYRAIAKEIAGVLGQHNAVRLPEGFTVPPAR